MTDTPIPDDVINVSFPIAVSLAGNVTDKVEASLVQLAAEHQIARAILADREAQAKRVEELEDGLRPFATEADAWEGFEDDEALTEGWPNGPSTNLHVSDLRTARALLATEGSDA